MQATSTVQPAQDTGDKRAPMAAAPMKYLPDGSVDWGNMWDSFCVLAKEGGPPHRGTMLHGQDDADPESAGYRFAVAEIARGIGEVSGLEAYPAKPGWLAVRCASPGMARWLQEAILEENVNAASEGALLFVPVGETFSLKGEIKNVVTAVAKTTHYWTDHVPDDVKRLLSLEQRFDGWKERLAKWLGR
ncbi:MAG: hypothetical protein ABI670_01465 [Chloroflexota bacterium]